MVWTVIPDSDIDPDSPITTGLMTAIRDNVAAMGAQDSGAPVMVGANAMLLDTKTAFNSAQIDFTDYIDGTYDHYFILLKNIVVQNNGESLRVRISQASTFKSDANYHWEGDGRFSNASAVLYGNASDTFIDLASAISNASYAALEGYLSFNSPDNTTYDKRVQGQVAFKEATYNVLRDFGGSYRSAAAMDGLRFFMSGGNIVSGTFELWAFKNT